MKVDVVIKGIDKTVKSLKKRNDKASYRTLNILEKRSKKAVGQEVKEVYPIRQKDINEATKTKKAHTQRQYVTWKVTGYRPVLAKAKQIKKGGLSYVKYGKVRTKNTSYIRGGSKGFIIHGRHSGKELPVFRKAGIKRDVTVLRGHSIPYLFKRVKYMDLIRGVWRKDWKREYSKQLDRAGY